MYVTVVKEKLIRAPPAEGIKKTNTRLITKRNVPLHNQCILPKALFFLVLTKNRNGGMVKICINFHKYYGACLSVF